MSFYQVISMASAILCPIITALIMWGYKSDQKAIHQTISKNAENITRNANALEKATIRQDERMDKIEANFNDLKSELPMIYTLREDFIRSLNNVDKNISNVENRIASLDAKLDRILEKMPKGGNGNG